MKIIPLHTFIRPGGEIGRHAGLKILWPLRPCGFDSRPGYKSERETERERSKSSVSSSDFSHSHSRTHTAMFDFQKLTVYTKAKSFHLVMKEFVLNGNTDSITKDQLIRASFSIPLNIAEGSGRFSKRDRRNFFVIARSSVFECVAILDILRDTDQISGDQYVHFETEADELSRMLFAMIRNLD